MSTLAKKVILLAIVQLVCIFVWIKLNSHEISVEIIKPDISNRTDYADLKQNFLVQSNETKLFYHRLPNLNSIEWPTIEYAKLPARQAPLPAVFEPVMSKGQRNLMLKLLDIFFECMIANGMSDKFMIHGATLLGSFRHHDFVPWDDDADVLVDVSVRPKVQDILSKMEPEYKITKQESRDKFYTKIYPLTNSEKDVEQSRQTSLYSWGWPFLDISYYEVNDTHIHDIARSYDKDDYWPKSVIFPLSYRPFGPKWYPAPRDPLAFLQILYTPSSKCSVFGYSHILEAAGPAGSVKCRKLGFRYPFVEHGTCDELNSSYDPGDGDNRIVWSRESLIIRTNVTNRAVIHSICIPVPKHNVRCKTYGFEYRRKTRIRKMI